MYLDICAGMDVRLFPLLFAISFFNLEEDSPAYKTFSATDIEIIKTVIWSRVATSTFVITGVGTVKKIKIKVLFYGLEVEKTKLFSCMQILLSVQCKSIFKIYFG